VPFPDVDFHGSRARPIYGGWCHTRHFGPNITWTFQCVHGRPENEHKADWDIGFSLSYKNFAALDGLAQKVLDLRMKQYGDKSKEQQVIDKRVQNARVITSVLTREITLK
jgi:hypothetical protein